MVDPVTVQAAIAWIRNEQGKLLLVWNQQWQAFTLPVTSIHAGPPAEKPEQAALRAASESLHLPTRAVAGKSDLQFPESSRQRLDESDVQDGHLNLHVLLRCADF